MSRAYTVATIALALGTPDKWVDNALSHHSISGVQHGRQGVRRKISVNGVLELAISLDLIGGLGLSLGNSIRAARALVETGEMQVGQQVKLVVDLTALRRQLEQKLEFAVEAAPLPKRGRPPG